MFDLSQFAIHFKKVVNFVLLVAIQLSAFPTYSQSKIISRVDSTKNNSSVPSKQPDAPSNNPSELKKETYKAFGKLPISFEINHGQTNEQVKYLSRGKGYALFLTPTEAVLTLNKHSAKNVKKNFRPSTESTPSAKNRKRDTLRMKFVNGNPQTKIIGEEELTGKTNYLIGSDPSRWEKAVSNFKKVRYENIYTGIDLIYYGNQENLEYDFVVAPNHSPDVISLDFEGVSKLKLDADGNLILKTQNGELHQSKPVVYQIIEGKKQSVEGSYLIKGKNRIGFTVGKYDPKHSLIIDPVISYATFLGGAFADLGNDIAVDQVGNAYIVGTTDSANFPLEKPLDNTLNGTGDAFITKINSTGTDFSYSTYFGGNNYDSGNAIALDTDGNIYITGYTNSTNLPVVNPYQAAFVGGNEDIFVAKLDQTGASVLYCTYLGGSPISGVGGNERASSIAVDDSKNIYLTGYTNSTNFPLQNAAQGTKGSRLDAFVTKINSGGTTLVYSTFLGGDSNAEEAWGIAADADGNTYVGGNTASTNFPTLNAIQGTIAGNIDGFIAKYNAAGGRVYATLLGGTSDDYLFDLAIDYTGNVYVSGTTKSSTTFPRQNARQSVFGGGLYDGYVTKINAAGNAILFSTFHGGNGDADTVYGVAVDGPGNVYVTGETSSTNFPTQIPFQPNRSGVQDAFITKFNASGTALSFSTYHGGGSVEGGTSIAVSPCGEPYVVGVTQSSNYPATIGAASTSYNGDIDAFITKIGDNKLAGVAPDTLPPGTSAVGEGYYELSASIDPEIMTDRNTQIKAQIYYPTSLGDVRPLLVFLHGNHGTCGPVKGKDVPRLDDDNRFTIDGKCGVGTALSRAESPSYKGYEYVARELAKEGYFVVSINANLGITGTDGFLENNDSSLIRARGKLVLKHLQRLYEWNTNGTPPDLISKIGINLQNRLDFNNVGLMGHSRGGEGVRAAYNFYKNSSSTPAPEAPLLNEIIIDNKDTALVTTTGDWAAASTYKGFYDADYLTSASTPPGAKTITYQLNVPTTGSYRIYYRWGRSNAPVQPHATNVPIEVTYDGNVGTVSLDQRWLPTGNPSEPINRNYWSWYYLGELPFNASTPGIFKLSNTGTTGEVIADAVRLVPSFAEPNTPWQARIPGLNIKGIFEIAPTDTALGYNVEGTAWNVLLPMCDGDVVGLSGVKVFDRAMVNSITGSADITQKSTFTVWGTNHNFYNTEWQYDENSTAPVRCFGTGNVRLFAPTSKPVEPTKLRQIAVASMKAFFMGNVGATSNSNLNKNFNTRYELPTSVNEITRVDRGYAFTPNGLTSGTPPVTTTSFDDFTKAGPGGTSGAGPGNTSNGITMTYGIPTDTVALHDSSLRSGKIEWTTPNDNNYFQTALSGSLDLTSYQTLDFRISRQPNPTSGSAINLSGATNMSVQLVKGDGSLSEPVEICKYATVLGPVGGNAGGFLLPKPILQTVRIPLADFSVDLSQIKGVRFTFNITPKGAIWLANIRTSKLM